MPTMTAMVIDRFGGPEVLRRAEIERPVALPGQVVIEVVFAGVNPADWKAREGWLSRYFDYRFPFVLGFDAAGRVAELGEGVRDLAVGDRVVAASNQGRGERGSYAQFVAANSELVVKLPANVGFAEAAALPTAGMTAWEAVMDVGMARPGARVLVHGGAGGTGGFAVQIAKMAGAHIAATCGPANLDYVRALGADHAINYRAGRMADMVRDWAPDGLDLIVDTVGQGTLPDACAWLRAGGIVAPIGTLIPNEPVHDVARAIAPGVTVQPVVSSYSNQPRQLRALVDALAQGRIGPPAITQYPLQHAGEAHARVAPGHVRGKIVLRVADPEG